MRYLAQQKAFSLWIAIVAIVATASSAWAVKCGPDIDVTEVKLFESEPRTYRGYAAYLFRVRNTGKKAHHVRLEMPSRQVGSTQYHLAANGRSLKLAPGETAEVWLYKPPILMHLHGLSVTIDHKTRDPFSIDNFPRQGHQGLTPSQLGRSSTADLICLLSRGIGGEVRDEIQKADSDSMLHRSSGPCADWPKNWLAYSRFDAVVLTRDEYNQMTLETRRALADYLSAGGTVWLRDSGSLSEKEAEAKSQEAETEQEEKATAEKDPSEAEEPEANKTEPDEVTIAANEDVKSDAEADEAEMAEVKTDESETAENEEKEVDTAITPGPPELERARGFGTLLVGDRPCSDFPPLARTNLFTRNFVKNTSDANEQLPLKDHSTVPVKLTVLLLIGYAVLVGPILQVLLAWRRKRIWLIWILPLTAVVICLLVVGWTLVSEGVHGKVRMRLVTLLDQSTRRATTVGWAGFYSPLTDSNGLRFSPYTAIQPQLGDKELRERPPVEIDWTHGQHLQNGWLPARMPVHLRLTKVESNREKLLVRRDKNGAIRVTNALGADAESLVLRSEDGRWHAAETIRSGETVTLQEVSPSVKPTSTGPSAEMIHHAKYLYRNPKRWDHFIPQQWKEKAPLLKPGRYIVQLSGHPFVSTAMTDPGEDEGETIVIGRFEEEK